MHKAKPTHQASARIFKHLTHVAAAVQMLLTASAYAQITATGAAGQTPLLGDKAANGTPIVNIAPPTAGGVSRNQYSTFNVDAKGVVFNNSATGANSVLAAGQIVGNSQLGATPARVILNQVSGAKSVLAGKLEVVGSKADIIVANPTGIDCNGCGFINTAKATLVTGTPVMASTGAIRSFDVPGGYINVNGLDAAGATLNLLTGAASLDGPVKADVLNVVAGPNNVTNSNYLTTTPIASTWNDFHIKVKPLGNVQAGKIYLVSTDSRAKRGASLVGVIDVRGALNSTGNVMIASPTDLGLTQNPWKRQDF